MFELMKLGYEYNALEPVIDAQTMEIHYSKHHKAYVDNLNKALEGVEHHEGIVEILQNLDSLPEAVRTKVRNNGGGYLNHTLFWESMVPGGKPLGGKLAEIIGDFEAFKIKFSDAGMARFGSGWVWLTIDQKAKSKVQIESTPNQDNPVMEGRIPILGLDVWEHAYYLKYQNKRADYIAAWWNVVNWEAVGKRLLNSSSSGVI